MSGYVIATTSGACEIDGVTYQVHEGQIARADHPVVQSGMFGPLDARVTFPPPPAPVVTVTDEGVTVEEAPVEEEEAPVERATAAPGEKRTTSRKSSK